MPITLDLPGDLSQEIRTILRVNEARKRDTGSCAACLYWTRLSGGDQGECRRRDPGLTPGSLQAVWPRVGHAGWCGEWLPRCTLEERQELEDMFTLVPGAPVADDPVTCPHGFAVGSCFECRDQEEGADAV